MATEGFIARRTIGDGGPVWVRSVSVETCDGYGAPGEPSHFARHHRVTIPVGVYSLSVGWRVRTGRRLETVRRRACAACGFVLLGIAGAYRGGGSAVPPRRYGNDSASSAPSRGLIGERLLWLAVLRDAVAIIAGRGADVTPEDVEDARAWIESPSSDVGSLAFVAGVLGLDVDATRAALRRLIAGPSREVSTAGTVSAAFR